jgi:hypothetical protein
MLPTIAVSSLALALALGGVSSGQPAPAPEVSVETQKPADPVVEEAVQLLTQASTTLSRVDPAVDRPMSDSERAASKDLVEDARRDLDASGQKPKTPTEARDLARESRDLADEALSLARDGKRSRALQRFTRSIIKMQAARLAVEPALTADQRGRLASSDASFPEGAVEDPTRKPLFTIRGKKGKGGIYLGRDGLQLQRSKGGEGGSITIGPGKVRLQKRDGSDRAEGITVGGNSNP